MFSRSLLVPFSCYLGNGCFAYLFLLIGSEKIKRINFLDGAWGSRENNREKIPGQTLKTIEIPLPLFKNYRDVRKRIERIRRNFPNT